MDGLTEISYLKSRNNLSYQELDGQWLKDQSFPTSNCDKQNYLFSYYYLDNRLLWHDTVTSGQTAMENYRVFFLIIHKGYKVK